MKYLSVLVFLKIYIETKKQKYKTHWCLLYGSTLISIHNYEKTMALTIWIFIGKVMSLLFNTLSMFVIAFLP